MLGKKNKENQDKQGEIAPSSSLFSALIYLGLSVLSALIIFGVFGTAGAWVTDRIFLGIFGFASYGYIIGCVLIGLLKLFKVRRKVSRSSIILYVITLLVIVLMCHLATSRHHATSWGEYIKNCYMDADTAGGVIMSFLVYPLIVNKAIYVVTMVVLGLVVGGLTALIIVGMLNLDEGVFAWRKRSKLGKVAGDETYYNQPRRSAPDFDSGEGIITRSSRSDGDGLRSIGKGLYVGDKDGKRARDKEIRETWRNRPTNFTPIEKLDERYEDVIPPDANDYLSDGVIDTYKKIDKVNRRGDRYDARDALHIGREEVRGARRARPTRDAAKDMLYGNSLPIDEEEVTLNNERGIGLSDEEISMYTNNRRRQLLEENIKRQREGYTEDVTPVSRESDISDISAAQPSASAPFMSGNDVKSSDNAIDDIINDAMKSWKVNVEGETEDKSNHTDDVFDDFSDIFDKNKQQDKQVSEDKPAEVREEPKEQPNPAIAQKPLPVKPVFTPVPKPVVQPKPEPKPQPKAEEKDESAEGRFNGMPILTPHKYKKSYAPPKLELLNDYQEAVNDNTDFNSMVSALESMLEDFRTPAKVVNIVKGPRFSRFELQMPKATSVKEIPKLEEDIKACLMVNSIRIEAPIRGKNLVGIEVPNKEKGAVGLKKIINSMEFAKSNKDSGIYFAMGKDIDNVNYVCNIADFPHALVAGASGAGKSVFLNCLLCSMLYKYSPEEVRFLLIDPKVVEFKPYEGLPHLLLPYAISDEKMVLNALNWLVNEMEYRYSLFSQNRVSNLTEYNASGQARLPKLVLIVDEVGDIMTSSISKEFEVLIKRLAQKARAAGIHIILATQRPSVDVITGTIKANLPTRIAFAVTSYVDSKTILDTVGAEKLLRYGDLLYKEGSMPDLMRVQGALIVSKEIYAVCDYVKQHNEAYFDPAIESFITTIEEEKPVQAATIGSGEERTMMEDPYFKTVLEYCIQTGGVSISKIQRRFNLGFPRAARLVDRMEEYGYIEPQVAGKNRGVLITQEQFNELYGNGGAEGDE